MAGRDRDSGRVYDFAPLQGAASIEEDLRKRDTVTGRWRGPGREAS